MHSRHNIDRALYNVDVGQNDLKTKVKLATYFKLNKQNYILI